MKNIIENIYYLIVLVIVICLTLILLSYEINKRLKRPKMNVQIPNMKKIMNIEELREKFKYDLVGRWASCESTFANIMNEIWIFYSDGKGVTISNSIISGEDKEKFLWRKKDLYCIELSYSEFDEPAQWIEISYDFCKVTTDVGFVIALVQLDKEGKPRKGFGLMDIPLSYEYKVN